MMISPDGFITHNKNKSYEELLPIRDELLKAIHNFENHRHDQKSGIRMHPSPEVVYQCNLMYLGRLCELIADKYNREIVWGEADSSNRPANNGVSNIKESGAYWNGIIGPKTTFATHADALNTCFGFHYKLYQKAYKDIGNGYGVWFPNIAKKAGGEYLSSDEYLGWVNILSGSGDTITQLDNADYSRPGRVDKNKRIIFARFDNERRYTFIGVFSHGERVQNGVKYTRIGTMFDTKNMEIVDDYSE